MASRNLLESAKKGNQLGFEHPTSLITEQSILRINGQGLGIINLRSLAYNWPFLHKLNNTFFFLGHFEQLH